MRSGKKLLLAVLLVYGLIAIGYSLFSFFRERKAALMQLDSNLYAAAYSLDIILGKDFHDRYTPLRPISREKYNEITEELNAFAASLKLEYVYSMVKRGDTIYFVVSNETVEDRARHTPSVFYNPYPNPPRELEDAFRTGTTEYFYYASYVNVWNSFYSVFIPRRTLDGEQYVLAADIKLSYQKNLLKQCVIESLVLIFILMLPMWPAWFVFTLLSRRRENGLKNQLFFELLTGLPNLNSFVRDMRGRGCRPVSLVIFNIDGFRNINNLFGVTTGDETLSRVGDILGSACRPSDRLYKLPADEFLVATDNECLAGIVDFASRVIAEISALNFAAVNQPFDLSSRAGIVFGEEDAKKAFSRANMAVRSAKETRREIVVYDSSIDTEKLHFENFFWLGKLKDAMRTDRVVPFYQPIRDNATGKCTMYEALVRIIDVDGSVILPSCFLEIAKQSKLYRQLTHIMIRKSLADFSGTGLTVSLNFTARDIADGETVAFLFERVKEFGMERRVVIELVESESMTMDDRLSDFFDRASCLGIRFAIDDFGSGYSNFEYISRIKADFLKIDGSIILDFLGKKESVAIVEAIASFARKLGIAVVAEYVSCDAEIGRLAELGVGYSQGFFLGKPMRFEDVSVAIRDAAIVGDAAIARVSLAKTPAPHPR